MFFFRGKTLNPRKYIFRRIKYLICAAVNCPGYFLRSSPEVAVGFKLHVTFIISSVVHHLHVPAVVDP